MTYVTQDKHARSPPDIEKGAERGEDVRRTLPEAMDRARQIVRDAMAVEAAPMRGRAGPRREDHDGEF